MYRPILALALVALLTACSSLGGFAPASSDGPRDVDLVADNLTTMIFALDLPDTVEPQAQGPLFAYAVNDRKAPPFLETTLELADAQAAMAALPPPAAGRSYHIYAVPESARSKLRELQRFARGLPKRPSVTVNIVPRLCLAGSVDKRSATYSVRAVLPGRGAVRPLIADEQLAALELRSSTLPPCAGHSG